MVDKERVTRLLDQVRADVDRLRAFATRDRDALLADDTAMNAMKYCFVTAIEGCTRVAHHVIASEAWSAPDTNAAAVRELSTRGVITRDVGEALADATGFRNVLVHRYTEVDDGRVVDHVGEIGDLEQFVAQVATWLDSQD